MFKKMLLVSALTLTAVVALPVNSAQAALRVGGDGAFILPLGDWSDAASVGLGVFAKGEYDVMDNLAVTARLGYLYHLSKEQDIFIATVNMSTTEMPLLVGAKFYPVGPETRVYGAAELGFVNFTAKASVDGGSSTSDSELKLGATLGGGYEMNGLDLRGTLFIPSLTGVGEGDNKSTLLGVMLTVGYAIPVM